MLLLRIHVGKKGYAIDCRHIVRILPQVNVQKAKHVPYYVVGLMNVSGILVPLIDFCQLIDNRETGFFLHSRIILLQDRPNSPQIGLLAERVMETFEKDMKSMTSNEVESTHLPFLHKCEDDKQEEIEYLNVSQLFTFLLADNLLT